MQYIEQLSNENLNSFLACNTPYLNLIENPMQIREEIALLQGEGWRTTISERDGDRETEFLFGMHKDGIGAVFAHSTSAERAMCEAIAKAICKPYELAIYQSEALCLSGVC